MSRSGSRLLAVTALVFSLTALAACGSSGASAPTATDTAPTATGTAPTATGTAPTATGTAPGMLPTSATATATTAPIATVGLTAAGSECPSAATVNTALGTNLANPSKGTGGGSTTLPAGAIAISCNYTGTGMNVIIVLVSNIPAASIDLYSAKFPVAFKSVSGVGDQARSFSETLGGGKTNEGVVATKGNKLVLIDATATPASLAQVEALVSQLL